MKTKGPEELWESFSRIIPSDASETQVRETKRAFTSGMFVVMQFLKELGDSEAPEEATVMTLDRFSSEVDLMLAKIIRQDFRQEKVN